MKGRILAKTVVSHNIVFTSPNNFDEDDYELYAKRIVKVFSVSAKDFTDEDKIEIIMDNAGKSNKNTMILSFLHHLYPQTIKRTG